MKFWDSSAIVPVLVEEQASSRVKQLISEDRDMTVWWATSFECTSAIVRRERLGQLAAALAGPDRDAQAIEMVCLDQRLTLAAEREGLRILG